MAVSQKTKKEIGIAKRNHYDGLEIEKQARPDYRRAKDRDRLANGKKLIKKYAS